VLAVTKYQTRAMDAYMASNPLPKPYDGNVIPSRIESYDHAMDTALSSNDVETFASIFYMIKNLAMHVDYVHSTKLRTSLSIAAQKGLLKELKELLRLGANPQFRDIHGKSALDYAKENVHAEICDILTNYNVESKFKELAYLKTCTQRIAIDHELLCHVIHHIHTEKPKDGSILVFLPGYEDILEQKEQIEKNIKMDHFQLFVLHSGVNETDISEQSRVFERMPSGVRKIILSTNISQTSLTISDVVRVVCGIFTMTFFKKILRFI
jgi:ATP-dependent RNA helicase DHX36